MEHVWTYYNTLPEVLEADQRFQKRDEMFSALKQLLAKHGNMYGLCLIHRHCTLESGEIMLSEGNMSQPVSITANLDCYAERWLSSGKPFEFTTQPTGPPPAALLRDFSALVGDDVVLGLYYAAPIDDKEDAEPQLEWTEGRKNWLRLKTAYDTELNTIGTAWRSRGDGPMVVEMKCVMECIWATTKSGKGHVGQEHVA